MTICGCPLSAHRFVQALERVGFGDSTIKGCALGQASCPTLSHVLCCLVWDGIAAAPGKAAQATVLRTLCYNYTTPSMPSAGTRPRVCLLDDLQHPEVSQAQVPAARGGVRGPARWPRCPGCTQHSHASVTSSCCRQLCVPTMLPHVRLPHTCRPQRRPGSGLS
jgi:hypothetical protein